MFIDRHIYEGNPRAKPLTPGSTDVDRVVVPKPPADVVAGRTERVDGKASFVVQHLQCAQLVWNTLPHLYNDAVMASTYVQACWPGLDWDWFLNQPELMQKPNHTIGTSGVFLGTWGRMKSSSFCWRPPLSTG